MLASCAFAATDNSGIAGYRYTSAIALPDPAQGEELAQVLLTPEMFSATQDNYADLRIMRTDTRQMVPSLVECVTQEQRKIRRVPEPLTLTHAGDTPDNQLRVTFTRPRRPAGQEEFPLLGLTVKTPLRDFERHVQVEVSEDGSAWRTLVGQARIFDVSSFADLRVTDIVTPPITQRHIRLTFNKHDQQTSAVTQVRTSADSKGEVSAIDRSFREEQRPFRIDGVTGWSEESYWERDVRPLRTREIRPTQVTQSKTPQDRLMYFEADRVPLESLTMDTPERFVKIPYRLSVEVGSERPDGGEHFRQIASGVRERVAFRDYLSERMTITWPTTRAKRYILSVPDDATPVLTFAKAKGPDYRVVFPYTKGDTMTLLAGNPEAGPAEAHASQIKMLMRTIANPLIAEPSPLEQNPAWTGKPPANINMTLVLTSAIAVAVIVLGFALNVAMRRLPQNENE
jgi:hypothetical protein